MSFDRYHRWVNVPIEGIPYLSVIIPALNEEERIIPTIRSIATYISTLGFSWELLVVDGGSSDGTVSAVKRLNMANLKLLMEPTPGKGAGLRCGALAASGEYVLFFDADNATPIEGMKPLLNLAAGQAAQRVDIAVGWRSGLSVEDTARSGMDQLLRRALRWCLATFFKIEVDDPLCGFKVFTQQAAHELYRAQTLTGFTADLEILYLARKWGYKVGQVPVGWVSTLSAKSSANQVILDAFRDMLTIAWNDWQKRYDRVQQR